MKNTKTASVSNGNSVQTFAHPYFHREGKDMLDTITRKTAKNVKKCKGEIIKELQYVETEYRKRFRDMESRNQQLERKNEVLEVENKRLKGLFEEMEKAHQTEPVPVMRLPIVRNIHQMQLAPLFETHCGVEPLLEVASTSSEDATSYASSHEVLREKIVDDDILNSLMGEVESNWCYNNNNNNNNNADFIM